MPEGDTVFLTAKNLDAALAGQVLARTDFRVPQLAVADLSGQTVLSVVPRGKHLLTRTDAGVTLHSHLRMDGMWRVFRAGERWTGRPAHQIRAVLVTAECTAVGFHVHDLRIVATDHEHLLVGHLGPDVCQPDFDTDEAVRRLRAQPDRAIAPALLDQRNLAGIGNVYACESLFLHGVSPWTDVGDIPDLAALVHRARDLVFGNRDVWSQSTTGSTRRGEEHWVYRRERRPCRRCGTPIDIAEQIEAGAAQRSRTTWWCPTCQPGR